MSTLTAGLLANYTFKNTLYLRANAAYDRVIKNIL